MELPHDMTQEEAFFIEIVKQKMLQKLKSDRRKFIFLYCIELGHNQNEAAEVLGVNEPNVSRHMKRIRALLSSFRDRKEIDQETR
jgi:DNA-directed RNA polymerase specialized sigma24 family protein